MANNAMGLKWQSSYFQLQDQLKLLRLNKAKEKDHQNLMGGTYEKKRKRKEKKTDGLLLHQCRASRQLILTLVYGLCQL